MNGYLQATEVIDWKTAPIRRLADELRGQSESGTDLARHAYLWVRDNIHHSLDFGRTEVTWRASDVLGRRTGYCYAKSHLLAALLRANGIPAGFCYQRLTVDGVQPPFCLHGLNAVYLAEHGWYRIDARGNKQGVRSEFSPPREQLPFATEHDGECDFPEIWAAPLPIVLASLQNASSVQDLATCLPDIPPEEMKTFRDSAATTPFLCSFGQ